MENLLPLTTDSFYQLKKKLDRNLNKHPLTEQDVCFLNYVVWHFARNLDKTSYYLNQDWSFKDQPFELSLMLFWFDFCIDLPFRSDKLPIIFTGTYQPSKGIDNRKTTLYGHTLTSRTISYTYKNLSSDDEVISEDVLWPKDLNLAVELIARAFNDDDVYDCKLRMGMLAKLSRKTFMYHNKPSLVKKIMKLIRDDLGEDYHLCSFPQKIVNID